MDSHRLIVRCVLSTLAGAALAAGCSSASNNAGPPSTGSASSARSSSSASAHPSSSASSSASTAGGASSSSSASSSGALPGLLGPYTTSGNKILDKNGNEHFFRGLDRPSLEYSCAGDIQENDYFIMNAEWGANVVRLPMNQDCWLNDPSNPSYDPTYAGTVDDQVQFAQENGMDIILDLHWSDRGSFSVGASCLTTTGGNCQQDMADANSQTFWQQVATKYKNVPNVIFELYNEPHIGGFMPAAADWNIWLNGGTDSSPTSNGGGSVAAYTVVGMQALVNTIRQTVGANNPIIIGGLDWSYNLTQVPGNAVTGANIIYNTHPYSNKTPATPASWTENFGFLTMTYPVIATEFGNISSNQPTGCDATFDQSLIAYMNQQESTSSDNPPHAMSWTAWAFYPASTSCTFPSLIADSNDDPNAPGMAVIAGLSNP